MTRAEWALLHPLTTLQEDMALYQSVDTQPDGNLLLTVLAVDR